MRHFLKDKYVYWMSGNVVTIDKRYLRFVLHIICRNIVVIVLRYTESNHIYDHMWIDSIEKCNSVVQTRGATFYNVLCSWHWLFIFAWNSCDRFLLATLTEIWRVTIVNSGSKHDYKVKCSTVVIRSMQKCTVFIYIVTTTSRSEYRENDHPL